MYVLKSKELVHVACDQSCKPAKSANFSHYFAHYSGGQKVTGQFDLIRVPIFGLFCDCAFFLYIISMSMVIHYNCEICYLVLLLAGKSPCFFQVFLDTV